MAYFPILIEFENAPVLIAGGGQIALHKAELLKRQGADITVIAPEICKEISDLCVKTELRTVRAEDAEDKILVIDASGSKEAEKLLSEACKRLHIPYNCAGHGDACTAIFPAIFKKGRTLVAVSSLGASPPASVWLRDRLSEDIPENMDEILEKMAEIRITAKENIPSQPVRKQFLHACLDVMIKEQRVIDEEETEEILKGYI